MIAATPPGRSLTLRERTQEINAEYWAARDLLTERIAVAQLCLALARAEAAVLSGRPPQTNHKDTR